MSYLVATPQGYRRKIGPRSRYGTTPDGSAYQRTPTMADRVNRDTQMTGTAHRSRNPHAERESMEAMQREKADRYLFDQEKRKANQARKREEAQRNEATTSKASASTASTASTVAAGMVGGPMAAKLAGGISSFLAKQRTGMDRAERAKQAAADRAKGRAKYEAEKSGKAPEPTMAEKKPEPRKEAAMPTASHSSPVRASVTKPASKPEPKTVAPHLLFTDRAPKQDATPAPKARAIDSYVSNPANRSVMTGKSRAQEIANEAAAKKKRERENMFRPKYMPNKARF